MPRLVTCWLALACLALFSGLTLPAQALDLKQRTVSAGGQFTVYSTDAALRSRVASFASELKDRWLQLIGENDHWKYPIIVTLDRAVPGQAQENPVTLSLFQYEAGFKVQIDVRIGADPAQVNLQKHLLRALCVEYAYRLHPEAPRPGQPFAQPPWWLVEGALQLFQTRDSGVETDIYKRIMELDRVPPLSSILPERLPDVASTATESVDRACALCLMQLLVEQPSGRASLASFLRHLPDEAPDPVLALQRDFPTLASEAGGAQKWWTLNLGRLSAADRFKGLSPEETDAELTGLLQFDVPIPGGKGTDRKSFGIGDFDEYLKLPGSRPILAANLQGIVALSTRANALYRGIVAEYDQIFALLARGKTHGIKDRLARVSAYRESLLRQKSDIADYLNWFEATQMNPNRRAFEGYIKAANELSIPDHKSDPISRYLDEIADEL